MRNAAFPRSLVLALCALFTPFAHAVELSSDCDPPPDSSFRDSNIATTDLSRGDHSRVELLGYIAQEFGQPLADEIAAATDPDTGCAELRENWSEDGSSDATTIAIRTRGVPIWFSAVILIHEYEHWKRSRPVGEASGDPHATDPDTHPSNPCGRCNHAMMGVDDVARLGQICSSMNSTSDRNAVCQFIWHSRRQIARMLTACVYEGCSACCGFSYVPNVDEILTIPGCCTH